MSESELIDLLREQVKASTQRIAAARLGVSPQYINDVVHGRRYVSAELAARLGYRREIVFTAITEGAEKP